MAPHPSTLAWKIPWMEEPGRLQSMGSLRVEHDWATSLSLFSFTHWRRKWHPTPVFLPGESRGQGRLVGCRHGVAQSQTRLKWLSSLAAAGSFGIPAQSMSTYTSQHSINFRSLGGSRWPYFYQKILLLWPQVIEQHMSTNLQGLFPETLN